MVFRSRILGAILAVFMLIPAGIMNAQRAEIKIDIDRTIGKVDSNIYGSFVEHLGRCVYGGIYDKGNSLSDSMGFRKDVIQAVKDLHVTQIRYPGGNFVSNYHWLDGVGPVRIPRLNLAWGNLETNKVGTDEFMYFLKQVGAKPYFAVNMGTGTIEEARRWVEYCNVKSGPYYAELRKKYGHQQPYNIKYWSLGNEMDGYWQMGHLDAGDYVKKAREAAKLMKLTSPEIKLIGTGSSNYRPGADPNDWNETILHGLRDYIDYISLHIYVGNPEHNYYDFMATPLVMEQRTKIVKGMIARQMENANRGNRPPIYIAWDEYNVWYRARTDATMKGTHALEEHYNLEDALVIAEFLNGFVRNADVVKMANLAQLVNVIAPIFTNETGLYKQTIYYPFQLFAGNVYGTSLDVYVKCGTYNTNRFFIGLGESQTQQSNVPYLDVSATYNGDQVTICVVNRNKDKAIPTDIICQTGKFSGDFEVYEINGPDVMSTNDFKSTTVKTVKKPSVKSKPGTLTYSFPPHSFTMLKGTLKR